MPGHRRGRRLGRGVVERAALARPPFATLATLMLVAWLATLACSVPPPRVGATPGPRGAAALPPVPAAAPRDATLGLPTTVRVRLEFLDGRSVVEVVAPDGTPRGVRRVGDAVADSAGRAQTRWVFSAPEGAALRVGGRAYPGRLVVSPHPTRGLRVHNELDLERYVAGVVASELAIWSAPAAELEAQAVAARTYAAATLARRARAGDAVELVDGVMDQAYRGLFQPDSTAALAVAQRLDAAVAASRGVVLVRSGALEEARFHASCGGHTAAFDDVFPEFGAPGSRGRPCPPCAERAAAEAAAGAPDARRPLGWSVTVPPEALARAGRALGLAGPVRALAPKRLDRAGRWLDVQLVDDEGVKVVPYDDLRAALGYEQVKSARLVRAWPSFGRRIEAGLRLEGLGRGHGVGLCQEGTRDLAREGLAADEILRFYYPGAELQRLPSAR